LAYEARDADAARLESRRLQTSIVADMGEAAMLSGRRVLLTTDLNNMSALLRHTEPSVAAHERELDAAEADAVREFGIEASKAAVAATVLGLQLEPIDGGLAATFTGPALVSPACTAIIRMRRVPLAGAESGTPSEATIFDIDTEPVIPTTDLAKAAGQDRDIGRLLVQLRARFSA
jgi:hypothetical protein